MGRDPLCRTDIVLGICMCLTGTVSTAAEVTDASQLEEITVTAQKYSEPLSKVPMSVLAYDGRTMDELGVHSLNDIQSLAPSLDIAYPTGTGNGNASFVTLRGIGSTSGAATTAVYIDDVPIEVRRGTLGISGDAMPTIFDLDRIEILRGPQGTLFGADAEGGAIRYITPQPVFTHFSGFLREDVSYTQNGTPSYESGIAAGGPLIDDTLAFRASFDFRREGGYIDRVDFQNLSDDANSNSDHSAVARVAFALKPGDNWLVTPAVYFQETRYNDANFFWLSYDNTQVSPSFPASNPGSGKFVDGNALPQIATDRWVMPSLKVEGQFGGLTFTSITGYFDRHYLINTDYTNLVGLTGADIVGPVSGLGEYPSGTTDALQKTTQNNLTQELRLARRDPAARVQFTAGLYFANLRQYDDSDVSGSFLSQYLPFAPGEPLVSGDELTRDKQYAAFGQIDLRVAQGLTLSGGVRVARQEVEFHELEGGFLVEGPVNSTSYFSGSESETATTPKLTLTYLPGDSSTYYLNIAKGERPGGTQPAPPIPTGVPSCEASAAQLGVPSAGNPLAYKEDTTTDTEIGAKNKFFNGEVSTAFSVYHIEWNEVQQYLQIPNCAGVGYIANLGKARVNGADLQINARPLASLLFTLSLSYTDAAYTKNSQVANGYTTVYAGDSILAPPTGVTPWSGSVQARYSFSAHGLPGYVLLDDRAKSHNPGPYTNNPDPLGRIAYDPATNLLNGRLNLSVYGTDVALYCNNILDAHPLLGVANNYLGANDNLFYASTFRPRTLGLTLERKF